MVVVGHRVSEVATQQAVARCQTERDSPHSGSRRMHTAQQQPSPSGGGFFIGERLMPHRKEVERINDVAADTETKG